MLNEDDIRRLMAARLLAAQTPWGRARLNFYVRWKMLAWNAVTGFAFAVKRAFDIVVALGALLTDAADVLDCAVATEICNNLVDDDGDGQIDCADTDCDGQACNDEDACSTGESCSGGLCRGGSAITCNDSNICTDNHCNPASGCYYTNNTAPRIA